MRLFIPGGLQAAQTEEDELSAVGRGSGEADPLPGSGPAVVNAGADLRAAAASKRRLRVCLFKLRVCWFAIRRRRLGLFLIWWQSHQTFPSSREEGVEVLGSGADRSRVCDRQALLSGVKGHSYS